MDVKDATDAMDAKDALNAVEQSTPTARLAIGGSVYDAGSPHLASAIAWAYAARRRPRCLCRPDGVEMYVARFGGRYVVKRMPDTGSNHAPPCPSFEPPAACSGLDRLLGSAIIEDPTSGITRLRLGFPMSIQPKERITSQSASVHGSVAVPGAKMSLRGLLHYMWDQADLTRWHPGFEGRRSWRTVRKHLLDAAGQMAISGTTLDTKLYVPEVFSVDQRDEINARRTAAWERSAPQPGSAQQLQLLIAEVKEFAPARHGYRAILKHVPDIAFTIDRPLFCATEKRLAAELELWSACDETHLVLISTFGLSGCGVPKIERLSLMPATRNWLPLESGLELQLLERLVRDRRSFRKILRYDTSRDTELASLVLTDRGDVAPAVYATQAKIDAEAAGMGANADAQQSP
ncbi:MAG: DUF1173 domain-containing protein [Paucibacter sp.]|nr:DUF1173 domain-containing protein [Roseateles sp.]